MAVSVGETSRVYLDRCLNANNSHWLPSVSRYGVLRREIEFGAPSFAFCIHTAQIITERGAGSVPFVFVQL